MRLLLDTHALIWYREGCDRLRTYSLIRSDPVSKRLGCVERG
jgi:PIN domain nuclease of toxin-antitoxin system